MKATGKDALNLIRHWKDESSQLRCTCASEGVGLSLMRRVAELSDSVLSIKGTACEALITLGGVSYEYPWFTGCPVGHPGVARWPVRERDTADFSKWGHVCHGRGENRLVAGGPATLGCCPPVAGVQYGHLCWCTVFETPTGTKNSTTAREPNNTGDETCSR